MGVEELLYNVYIARCKDTQEKISQEDALRFRRMCDVKCTGMWMLF